MNGYGLDFLTFRHWTSILLGLSLIIFGGFYFFNVSVKTKAVEKPAAEQNLVNGRLAFSWRSIPSPEGGIITSNPDGTGQTAVPITGFHTPAEPAWSPDGTRLSFAGTQNPGDIFVSNANGGGQINLTNTADPIRERNPSWSVTGKIAYERNPQTTSGQIWTMNTDGSGQAHFSAITQPFPFAPSWSPDGTKLAFASGGEIWVINADGTNERRVTVNTSTDTDPAWSPDGSKIVFAKGGSGISVINLDGTNETFLSGSGDIQPAWSPDGTKIAFRRTTTNRGIYTMDANGANQVRIVADIINFPLCCDILYENPAWQPVAQTPGTFIIGGRVTYNNLPVSGATVTLSGATNATTTTDAGGFYQFSGLAAGGSYTVSPSFPRHYFTPANRTFNNLSSNQTADFEVAAVCQGGKCVKNGKIAFVRNADIFTINADGTNETNITNNAAGNGAPDYSPDGSNIIFSTTRDGNSEIYRMNADGTSPVRLTNNAASDSSPYYSPDGATIVFESNRDGNNEIYKMNADGSNQRRLTNNTSSDIHPAFSPDGQKIIFISDSGGQRRIFTMNADGSNPQQFPAPGGFAPAYARPSYSPDGSKIIFSYTQDVQSQLLTIWTMNADGTNAARFPADGVLGTYSPDGTKVTYTCCQFDNTNRVRTANADGNSASIRILTPTNTGNTSPDWQGFIVPRPAPFDFDGDRRSDLSVFRPSAGFWYIARPTGVPSQNFDAIRFGEAGDLTVPADYDGDGITDIANWRPSDGTWYLRQSSLGFRAAQFGTNGDIPVPGDFDGDGKANLAVFRPSTGSWYIARAMGVPSQNFDSVPFGANGDKPIAGADFDGDGKADVTVFRPSEGNWYRLNSSNGQFIGIHFGIAEDKPVAADYDGDGKTDLAVYRPSDGVWYRINSGTDSFSATQFGINTDLPAPADYDGDSKADLAVFRPAEGNWYILRSTRGYAGFQFGAQGDIPTPNSFVR
ncbi:MAG TPA: FG-GAP-like repeat-containing protein [Pyrinomonadaceae bacterium]|jgi:Tol biopolymer transport system component